MTAVSIGLLAQMILVAVGVIGAFASPSSSRARYCGSTGIALGLAAATTGAFALAGRTGTLAIHSALPFAAVNFTPDRLGGFFMLVVGVVGTLGAGYAVGYAHGAANSSAAWVALPIFLGAMALVPAAADAISFLLMWEVMALASTVLVLCEYQSRTDVRSAGLWYAAMTHLSFLLLLTGFAILARAGGGTSMAAMATVDPTSGASSVAFVLLILGFATKSGVAPLHVWLPRAHPAAPSHVSALMSAAMVNLGVYGALLVALRLIPGGPHWWGVLIIALGSISAVYGILQASVSSDLKRLLAYSTTENVGLMFIAIGAAVLARSYGLPGAGADAIAACLLLVAGHAAFKLTLFLGAGAVVASTGERDLDRMGGLGSRMPVTAWTFGIGALGAAALPVTGGFVAEWALLQTLIHSTGTNDRLLAVVMPIAVSIVALTAGLALLTFVKAYGLAFLARPRSDGASSALEVPRPMQVAMAGGAIAVVATGLAPAAVGSWSATITGRSGQGTAGRFGINLIDTGALLDPVALTFVALIILVPTIVIAWRAARQIPRRPVPLPWGGGGVRLSPRMQYTATSYAEPLARVFEDALRPERDLEITHISESRYLVERIQFSQRLDDVIEARGYRPVIRGLDRIGILARRLQNGSIHRYLAYSFAALLVVLILVSP